MESGGPLIQRLIMIAPSFSVYIGLPASYAMHAPTNSNSDYAEDVRASDFGSSEFGTSDFGLRTFLADLYGSTAPNLFLISVKKCLMMMTALHLATSVCMRHSDVHCFGGLCTTTVHSLHLSLSLQQTLNSGSINSNLQLFSQLTKKTPSAV